MTLLERLCKADPEHFWIDEHLLKFRHDGEPAATYQTPVYKPEISERDLVWWQLAGIALERMQERWRERLEDGAERRSLVTFFDTDADPLGYLTPESIISAFCDWQEARKVKV